MPQPHAYQRGLRGGLIGIQRCGAFGLVSRRLESTVLTAPLVFVVAGFVLGPAGLGLVEFKLDDHTVLLVGEIALAIVLFTDAAKTNLSALRQNEALPLRLLGIGMPLTIALGTLVAALVLTDFTFWEAPMEPGPWIYL